MFGRIHFTGAGRRCGGWGGGGVFFNNIILTHQRHPRLCLRICSSTVLLHLNSKHTLTGALGRTAPAARMKGYVRVCELNFVDILPFPIHGATYTE